MWTCPKCETEVEPAFGVCWNCGTTRDGVEDPGFVTADEAGPIRDIPLDLTADPKPTGLEDLPEPPTDLVVCGPSVSLMEAQFIADELIALGIPALVANESLGGFGYGSLSPGVMVRAQDQVKALDWIAAFERKKLRRTDSVSRDG